MTTSTAPATPDAILGTAIPGDISATLPAIGSAFSGGVYAGIIRGVSGAPDSHLILLPGDAENVTWDKAAEFAQLAGGELPTRREQALLFANLPEQFKPRWYWSGEQYAAFPSDAWFQGFVSGGQVNVHKTYEGRARAVRRLKIQ